jgi:hypothetical protein
MKGGSFKIKIADLKKGSAEIRVNKDLDASAMRNAPFFKAKMARAEKILQEVGLPKEIQEELDRRRK